MGGVNIHGGIKTLQGSALIREVILFQGSIYVSVLITKRCPDYRKESKEES